MAAVVIMNARRFLPAALGSFLLLTAGASSVAFAADQTALPELRTAAQVRHLSVEKAELGYPVRLKGVLTFFDEKRPTKSFRFVQDDTAGIYFYFETGVTNPGLSVGQEVELEGHTGKGEFAPIVWVHQIHVPGEGTFPQARPVSFEQLASGQEDSQFVEVHGVVRSVRLEEQRLYFLIDVATGDSHLTAYLSELPVTRSEDLIDCTVRIRGVCFTQFNRQHQLFDFGLLLPRPEDLWVEKPAPTDAFTIAAQPIKSLLQYPWQDVHGHRLKVIGTVALCYGDSLYIQDDTQGLCVQTKQTTPLRIGDRVEVLGFATRGGYTPTLQSGVYRKLETGLPPTPFKVNADQALKAEYDCRLVTIEATLLDRAQQSKEPFLVLQSGGFIFHAYLKGQQHTSEFENLEKGSKVSVTGICVVDPGEEWHYGEDWRAESFRLLLRSPSDIGVIQKPPWWTLRKLLWAVGVLCAVVLGAFAWVAFLRRRVQQQTHVIRERLQAEAAMKERYLELFENANDVVFTHDLTGRLTSINSTGERLLQRDRAEILSSNLADFVAEEQRPAAKEWLHKVVKGTEPPAAEWDFVNAAGQRFKLEINTRMIEQNGHPLEIEAIGRDITERKRLEREILEVSNKEQQRIGHDLHDGVCQQLAAIAYRSHVLARRLQEKGVTESTEAEALGELVNQSLVQTRGVARGLFPVRLEENGLASALEELASGTTGLYPVRCTFTCQGPAPEVELGVGLHVYYIAQEAVLNAVRHGKARNVSITLSPHEDGSALAVQDDGSGFLMAGNARVGMGIDIMSYRARVIGATLDLQSQPGKGTQITCVFHPAALATGIEHERNNRE
jgi:PAS domain S-box-containing protein